MKYPFTPAIPNLDGIVGARQAGALLPEQNKSSSGLPRPYTKVIFGITAFTPNPFTRMSFYGRIDLKKLCLLFFTQDAIHLVGRDSMDTLSVIALIIIALIILAVIIAFRQKISLTLKAWGIDLGLKAENYQPDHPKDKPTQLAPPPPQPAGTRLENIESTGGGIYAEGGHAHDPTGVGLEAKNVKAKGDVIFGQGESGDPKANPPA
jgi:hypothetical protein